MSWCLVTDLDGTLIGESSSTIALRDAIRLLRANWTAEGPLPRWVIATGRGMDDACQVLLEVGFELSDFDAFVTSVGAELRFAADEAPHLGFLDGLNGSGFDAAEVRRVLDALPGMRLQPPHEQFSHKVSYFVDDTEAALQLVPAALSELPFETRCVFCHDNYLDVAPENGTKGGAVEFLRRHWELEPQRVVAAGDSGNDLSMLDRAWPGIVVGNGAEQLRSLRGREQVYFAQAKYAGGVLEGLRHLGLLP